MATACLDSLLFSDSEEGTKADRVNLNFHTDKSWGDKGKKMTWDVDYLYDKRDSHMGFLSDTQTPDGVTIPGKPQSRCILFCTGLYTSLREV